MNKKLNLIKQREQKTKQVREREKEKVGERGTLNMIIAPAAVQCSKTSRSINYMYAIERVERIDESVRTCVASIGKCECEFVLRVEEHR